MTRCARTATAFAFATFAVAAASNAQTVLPLTVSSGSFNDGETIPKKYTIYRRSDPMSPPIEWAGAPASTRQMAIVAEDLDAVPGRTLVQWVIYNITPTRSGLPERVPRGAFNSGPLYGVTQGITDFDMPPREGRISHTVRTAADSCLVKRAVTLPPRRREGDDHG
ncbi:MAG TPA: YbhB/YbcL family Raf kinase inhibitor-like protein [Vicinamibacterales bacterium]|nr:YbhB/YbcL family Raf kinase inhibitor-like protein [Vicinamibacterales bacterium]